MSSLDHHKLAASRLWAAHRFPYLATGLFACSIVGVPQLGGVAVDERWRLYIDPTLVDELPVEQIGSLLVHHVGHLLRDHSGRAASMGVDRSSADDWALAADAELNDDLKGADLQIPGEVVLPERFGAEEGRMAEEYFQLVRRKRDSGEDLSHCDCGSGADHQPREHELAADSSGIGANTGQLIRCQVASDCMRQEGLQPGTVPVGLLRWARELMRPQVDWRKVLATELRRGVASVSGCVDYSYARPSRRQSVMSDVLLPSMRKPVPEVAVVVDTSGSMSEGQLARALAEVEGLLRRVGIGANRLRVMSCDADVHRVQRISSARQVQLAGGGGTDMGRGIDAAVALRPQPQIVVVLTDGYTPWPQHGPRGTKVVVGLIRAGRGLSSYETPPWAKVVRIEDVA
ncbi:MAG TPA: VWA-like domain-containing protein [Actinomycetota bacterium]|nr:VWA-like domain-containing protein [Actinomycetota bacterium]